MDYDETIQRIFSIVQSNSHTNLNDIMQRFLASSDFKKLFVDMAFSLAICKALRLTNINVKNTEYSKKGQICLSKIMDMFKPFGNTYLQHVIHIFNKFAQQFIDMTNGSCFTYDEILIQLDLNLI